MVTWISAYGKLLPPHEHVFEVILHFETVYLLPGLFDADKDHISLP